MGGPDITQVGSLDRAYVEDALNYREPLFRHPCVAGPLTKQRHHWLGLYVVIEAESHSGETVYVTAPSGQGRLIPQALFADGRAFAYDDQTLVKRPVWYADQFRAVLNPSPSPVRWERQGKAFTEKVIILNCLDFIFGHALLKILNVERILKALPPDTSLIVIAHTSMKWLLGNPAISELWLFDLKFSKSPVYYASVSEAINEQLSRFSEVSLSAQPVHPTQDGITIETFSGIPPYNFEAPPLHPRVTYVWRHDAGRAFVANTFLQKVLVKLKLDLVARWLGYMRTLRLLSILHAGLGSEHRLTVAGMRDNFRFPAYVEDLRMADFSETSERQQCRVFAESALVIGVHGSSMILPSAHAGMALSLMPSKRWGNYLEDLIYRSEDVRVAAFSRRILPIRMHLSDLRDVCLNMIKGRAYFIKKFTYENRL